MNGPRPAFALSKDGARPASAWIPSQKMAAGPSVVRLAGPNADALPFVKMAPARASLPGFGPQAVGFNESPSVTPPRFRRKKRPERWRRLRFEFQRRRQSPNKSWIGGGGDLGNPAGRDRVGNQWCRCHKHQCYHLLCVHDGLGVGRGRHPPRDAQRLQVRPAFWGFAIASRGSSC